VAEPIRSERSTASGLYGPERRLRPGHVYFDINEPDRGPFIATGDEIVPPGSNIVAQEDFSDDAWLGLISNGFGEVREGAGDDAYDQGAFGQEINPRFDVLNAAPPGVGEGLTPRESEEEMPRD